MYSKEYKLTPDVIYYYKKDRKQHSLLFINMAVACLLYIAGLYGYEFYLNKPVTENFKFIYVAAFSVSSVILFLIAWWYRRNPGTYEAVITREKFVISYPDSKMWSFEINISDIERFERQVCGEGDSVTSGVRLKDGTFHVICMNYGSNVNKMFSAVTKVNPEITFQKKAR